MGNTAVRTSVVSNSKRWYIIPDKGPVTAAAGGLSYQSVLELAKDKIAEKGYKSARIVNDVALVVNEGVSGGAIQTEGEKTLFDFGAGDHVEWNCGKGIDIYIPVTIVFPYVVDVGDSGTYAGLGSIKVKEVRTGKTRTLWCAPTGKSRLGGHVIKWVD